MIESSKKTKTKAKAKAKPKATLKSPSGWLETMRASIASPRGGVADYEWQYAAAETAHGWKAHAHHAGKELNITKEDFDAALKAALGNSKGVIEPHKPALSKHK